MSALTRSQFDQGGLTPTIADLGLYALFHTGTLSRATTDIWGKGSPMGLTESKLGFTVIEILIVLVLLGIVGVTFVPQIISANDDARRTAVQADLGMLRRQIKNYYAQHKQFPAHSTNSPELFLSQLTQKTNHAGDVSETGRFGPYLIGDVPVNAYTQNNGVLIVPGELKPHQYAGHGDHGWVYSSTTGEFRANLSPNVKAANGVLVNSL